MDLNGVPARENHIVIEIITVAKRWRPAHQVISASSAFSLTNSANKTLQPLAVYFGAVLVRLLCTLPPTMNRAWLSNRTGCARNQKGHRFKLCHLCNLAHT